MKSPRTVEDHHQEATAIQERIAVALERIAGALERAHPLSDAEAFAAFIAAERAAETAAATVNAGTAKDGQTEHGA